MQVNVAFLRPGNLGSGQLFCEKAMIKMQYTGWPAWISSCSAEHNSEGGATIKGTKTLGFLLWQILLSF